METKHLLGQILLTLMCIGGAMRLWQLGRERGSRMLKQLAMMIAVAPLVGVGLGPAWSWLGWDRLEIRDTAIGPSLGEASSTYVRPFPVDHPGLTYQLALTPRMRGVNPPSQPLHLRFEVRSPTGAVLAREERDLAPASGFRWSTLQTKFQPREKGQHVLLLEIPSPVGTVDVFVK